MYIIVITYLSLNFESIILNKVGENKPPSYKLCCSLPKKICNPNEAAYFFRLYIDYYTISAVFYNKKGKFPQNLCI